LEGCAKLIDQGAVAESFATLYASSLSDLFVQPEVPSLAFASKAVLHELATKAKVAPPAGFTAADLAKCRAELVKCSEARQLAMTVHLCQSALADLDCLRKYEACAGPGSIVAFGGLACAAIVIKPMAFHNLKGGTSEFQRAPAYRIKTMNGDYKSVPADNVKVLFAAPVMWPVPSDPWKFPDDLPGLSMEANALWIGNTYSSKVDLAAYISESAGASPHENYKKLVGQVCMYLAERCATYTQHALTVPLVPGASLKLVEGIAEKPKEEPGGNGRLFYSFDGLKSLVFQFLLALPWAPRRSRWLA
jgi:hypothetical protein